MAHRGALSVRRFFKNEHVMTAVGLTAKNDECFMRIFAKRLFWIFVFAAFALVGFSQQFQEVVYTKNGSIVRGMIVEFRPNHSLKIQTVDGNVFVYELSEIEKITRESSYAHGQFGVFGMTGNGKGFRSGNGWDNVSKLSDGYRGFVDLGYSVGVGTYGTGRVEFATSHGYQFGGHLYAGVGTGINYYNEADVFSVPVFAHLRCDLTKKAVSPYLDVKLGYSLFDVQGFYFNPSIGCRFALSRGGINVGLGYSLQMADYGFVYNTWYYESVKKNCGGVSLRLSYDF